MTDKIEDKWICDTENKDIDFCEVTRHIADGHNVHNTLGKGIASRFYHMTPKGLKYYMAMRAFEKKLGELNKLSDEEIIELSKKELKE
jgi:hypothetical protein